MNKLSRTDRAHILRCLVDGSSIRATSRITGFSVPTILKLLVDIGKVCADYQDENIRGLSSKRIQCDEIWSFVGAKDKNIPAERKGEPGIGSIWTWTALDADSKLMITYAVGSRDGKIAFDFISDTASRLASYDGVQVTTDGHGAYPDAIFYGFGGVPVSYAQLIKQYGPAGSAKDPERRYSPAECVGTKTKIVSGTPDEAHISTSFVERQNLTMRMGMRRFTRLTNGFSKKVENHYWAISLHFMHYNYCRIHKTLRVTPAMAAGLTDKVWDLEDVIALLEAQEESAVQVATRRKDRRG